MTQMVGLTEAPSGSPAPPAPPHGRVGQVTVLVHTRNQPSLIADVVTRVEALPGAAAGEIVFVDDSDDATPAEIRRVAEQVVIPVHLLHRGRGERSGGLAGAVRAGMAVARCRHVCVIDCAEHAPEEIPALLATAAATRADLVVSGSTSRLFLVRRGAVDLDGVRARGSRLVRELVRRSPDLRVAEVPGTPARRTAKLSRGAAWRSAAPHPAG